MDNPKYSDAMFWLLGAAREMHDGDIKWAIRYLERSLELLREKNQ